MRHAKPFPSLILLVLVLLTACGGEPPGGTPQLPGDEAAVEDPVQRPQEGTQRDWEIFESTLSWAWAEGLDTLPMGEVMARLGLSFVGTPYAAGTLELEGPEDVVVNFERFDCVTLVENVLALARFLKTQEPEVLSSGSGARAAYRRTLQEIRYRGAKVEGYPSRLHYFSDWIRDNEQKGLVRDMTGELGGVEVFKGIDFMSTHPQAYRQLADWADLEAIRGREIELSALPLRMIEEDNIPLIQGGIENGDIIAATSTVQGLDVAHTGLAYWMGPDLHLLHAPLVGDSVEVSSLPLAERILRIEGQDGIMVVRALDPSRNAAGANNR